MINLGTVDNLIRLSEHMHETAWRVKRQLLEDAAAKGKTYKFEVEHLEALAEDAQRELQRVLRLGDAVRFAFEIYERGVRTGLSNRTPVAGAVMAYCHGTARIVRCG